MAHTAAYRISGLGGCSRAMVAQRLGYEQMAETGDGLILLQHCTRMEDVAKLQMRDEGFELQSGGICDICLNRSGVRRNGIHIEIEEPFFTLVGHLDGLATHPKFLKGVWYPLEVKSAGRFRWPLFQKNQFESFMGYAFQECVYLQARHQPGLYWVINRDNGKCLRYTVNDFQQEIKLPNFAPLELPITYEAIVEKISDVEINVQAQYLPESPYSEDREDCKYCRMKYLCLNETQFEALKEPLELSVVTLLEAAALYKAGDTQSNEGKDKQDRAKSIFLDYAKEHKLDKFRAGGLSVSYTGSRTKVTIDEKKLKDLVDPQVVAQLYKTSRAWEDLRVYALKEE